VRMCQIQPGVMAWSTLSRRPLTEVYHLPWVSPAWVVLVNPSLWVQVCPVLLCM
jgi:hypothetical protein